jgi:F-type H+-transporting ATPase subunit b
LVSLIPQFGEANSSSGISSLGLNLKAFVFQLITFLIVLLILRRWVFPKLVSTLEERRSVLEQSLEQARQTEENLQKANVGAAKILQEARAEADNALADAQARAKEIVANAEKSGEQSAGRIVKEAEENLAQQREQLRTELKDELADLVVATTEKIINKRLSSQDDLQLIHSSLKDIKK